MVPKIDLKKFRYLKRASLVLLCFITANRTQAQNCSINAGVTTTQCASTTLSLSGNSSGTIATAAKWFLVSGPNIPTITSPNTAATTVTNLTAGLYAFRYSATCGDGTFISDTVKITVDAEPVFTAGNDTTVNFERLDLKATLPAGATGAWTYSIDPQYWDGIDGLNFIDPTNPNTKVIGFIGQACPKIADMIWTVRQGSCTKSDTVKVTFKGQNEAISVHSPRLSYVHCGEEMMLPRYFPGCGGTASILQLSGPNTATTAPLTDTGSFLNFTLSGLIAGSYVFEISIQNTSGTSFKDTVDVIVPSIVPLPDPGLAAMVPNKYLCPDQFDTVYYLEPNVTLLPGQYIVWNTTPLKFPATLATPSATVMGNKLKLTGIVNPTSAAASPYYEYGYSYTVSNGSCGSNEGKAILHLDAPVALPAFQTVHNLPCGIKTVNVATLTSGATLPATSYNFYGITILSKPLGAPAPGINVSNTAVSLSNLMPGNYTYSFNYHTNAADGNFCAEHTVTGSVSVSAPAGLSNGGTNQILACAKDTTTLAGNIPAAGQTGTWQQVYGPSTAVLTNPNTASLHIQGLVPGEYAFRWSIANGALCPASVSSDIHVVVTPSKPVANAGPDDTTCSGPLIALNGNDTTLGTTGQWQQVSGPAVTITNAAAAHTTFSGSVPMAFYTFTWKLTNACGTDVDTVNITTGPTPGPSDAVIITPDTCINTGAVKLIALLPAVGNGVWSKISGPAATIAAPNNNVTDITGMAGGLYKFVWTVDNNACRISTDTVSVAYLSTALVANAGATRNVCSDSIHLDANVPALGFGKWSQIGGTGTLINDLYNPKSAVTGLSGTNTYDYKWTVSLGACPATSANVHISNSAMPSAAVAMNDTLVCGTTATLLSIPVNATAATVGNGSWSIIAAPTGGSTLTSTTLPSTIANVRGGVTKLLWQVTNGACPAAKDTVNIEIVPKADAGDTSYTICEGGSQLLQGTQPGTGTATWLQVNGPSAASITQPAQPYTQVTNMLAGSYTFLYTVAHPVSGCSSTDTVRIINDKKPVPDAGNDTSYLLDPVATLVYLNAAVPDAGTGVWNRTAGFGTVTYNPSASSNNATATITNSGAGIQTFAWMVTNGTCIAEDQVNIQLAATPLPLHLLSFEARLKDNNILLNWTATAEKQIRHYNVQHSTDGLTWATIGTIGSRNNTGTSDYEFADKQPAAGLNQYRLNIEEIEGNSYNSAVRSVRFKGGSGIVSIYPNPAYQKINIELQGHTASYQLTDATGRTLLQDKLQTAGRNTIDIHGIATGIYILRITLDGNISTTQVNIVK